MTNVNPYYTTFNHVFHPSSKDLSSKEQYAYMGASLSMRLASLGSVHLLHHYCHHSDETITPERVKLLSEDLEIAEMDCAEILDEKQSSRLNLSEPTEKINELSDIFTEEYQIIRNQLLAIDATKKNPWKEKQILTQYDKCIKLAFLIGMATLKNLDIYIKEKNINKTRVAVLTDQDTFHYKTSLMLPDYYHFARGPFTFRKISAHTEVHTILKSYTKENQALFYQRDTFQSSWRSLYNIYCEAMHSYVTKDHLQASDDRFVKWTRGDYYSCTFSGHPGTRPT